MSRGFGGIFKTRFLVDGIEYGSAPFVFPVLMAGDTVTISVPTGTLEVEVLEGHVSSSSKGTLLIGCPFRWNGAFRALTSGTSGVAEWSLPYCCGDVVTTAWDWKVPYDVYRRAHEMLQLCMPQAAVQDRQELLHKCIQFLFDLDATPHMPAEQDDDDENEDIVLLDEEENYHG